MFDFGDVFDLVGLDGIDMFDFDSSDAAQPDNPFGFAQIGETQFADLDLDGFAETAILQIDTNDDGIADSTQYITEIDNDLDGDIDQIIDSIDFGNDETLDVVMNTQDTDNNGVFDYFSQEVGIDTNGDHIIDSVQISRDSNMDGLFDEVFVTPLEVENATEYPDFNDTYENFQPEDYNSDTVIGAPLENMDNWHQQDGARSCAVVAQEFILDNITGLDFTEAELCEFASDMGWFEYGESGGTLPFDVGNILISSGLNVEKSLNNSADDLHEALANGGHVMVGVDADELWYGDNDSDFLPGEGANHVIQVIGIDYSNPDEPMVIINDSGHPDGCGAMIPMDDFVDAWDDGDNFMVVAYERGE